MMPALRLPTWLMAVLLALVTTVIYWPATRHDFVNFDDDLVVTANVHVQNGLTWENVKWAFCNPVDSNWHPLTVLSHMLDCQLFGLRPWGHHLSSVLLHAVNTALVFLLLFQMTGLRGNESPRWSSSLPQSGSGSTTIAATASARRSGAFWRSVMVAVLFGWHPVHVESVAWVAERKDVLSTFFGLLSLLFYVRYTQNKAALNSTSSVTLAKEDQRLGAATCLGEAMRRRKRSGDGSTFNYILALVFFAFGLMSKPMLVTWPLVMLLLDWWPLQRVSSFKFSVSSSGTASPSTLNLLARRSGVETAQLSTLVFEKLPFFVLAAVMSVVTFIVQQRSGVMGLIENLPLGARAENALISYCRYLGKLFWPEDLAVFYPYSRHWPMGEVLLAGVLLLSITVLCIVVRRRYPFMLMGWLWYVGTLVPVIGLVQVGDQSLADRYTYIPSIGVLVLVIWGAYELTRRWRNRVMIWSVAGCGAIILCVGMTRQQLGYWQDSETLFRHALEVTENNCIARNGLGFALYQKGQLDAAISQFQEAIQLNPDFAEGHKNLGFTFGIKGDFAGAISQYQEVVRLEPDDAGVHYSLGIALDQKGRLDDAISQYREAVRLEPDDAGAHYNLGTALGRKGQTAEAIRQFEETLRLKPDFAEAHYNLGTALGLKGQIDQAISEFQEAIRLKPGFAEARSNLVHALQIKNAPSSR